MASAKASKEYQLAIKIAGQVSSTFNSAMGDAEKRLTNLGTIAKQAAAVAAAAWGALQIGQFFSSSIEAAMNFESSMADVAKVVDGLRDSNGELNDSYYAMSDSIVQMSKNIPMTAQELAEITAAAGTAGIAMEELSTFTETAAKMGIAFDTTADQAGDWMAKWRTSFGMTQTEVTALADQINYLSNNSAATATEISTVVTAVGPLGDVAGISAERIAALGSTMIGVGVQQDVAATAIKKLATTMVAGASATKKQHEVLAQLGFDATDLAERMQTDAQGAILDFLGAVNQLPEAMQAAALKDYFGQESVGALAPLLTNLDVLQERFQMVGDATLYAGSMANEYAARASTSANNVQLFQNKIEALKIQLGTYLLPILNTVLSVASMGIDGIAQLLEGASGAFAAFGAQVETAIQSLVDYAIPKITAFKNRAVELFGMASEGIAKVVGEHSATFDKLGELASKVGAFFADLKAQAQPVLDYIAGTALPKIVDGALELVGRLADLGNFLIEHKTLVLAVVAAYAGFKGISALSNLGNKIADATKLLSTFENVTKGTSLAASAASGKLPVLSSAFGVLTGKIKLAEIAQESFKLKMASFTGGFKAIGTLGKTVFASLKNGFLAIGGAIKGAASSLFAFIAANPVTLIIAAIAAVIAIIVVLYNKCEWFREKVDAIIAAVKVYLQAFWEKAKEVFQGIWTTIKNVWSQIAPYLQAAWDTIISAVSAVVDFFKTSVLPGILAIWDSICKAFSAAWELIKTVWNAVKPYFAAIWEAIKVIFSVVVDVLGGFFRRAWNTIQVVWAAVAPWFSTIWEYIKAVFSVAAAVLGGFFRTAWEAIKAVWNTVAAYFQAVFDTIAGIFSAVKAVLQGDFSGAWEAIKGVFASWGNYFQTLWDGIKNIFGAVADWFSGIFTAAWNGVKNVFGSALESLKNSVLGFFQKVDEVTGGALTKIGEFFVSIWEGIKGVWNSVAGWFKATVIDPLVGFFSPIVETISGFFRGCWIIIQAIWKLVSGWFQNNVITPLVNFFAPIVETVSGFFSGLWAGIQAIWQTVSGWFQTTVIEPTVGFFSAIPGTIGGFFSGLWSAIQGIWATVSGWFQTTVITPLINFFAPIVESITGFFSGLWAGIQNIWQSAGTWFNDHVASPINSAFQTVSDFVKGIFNGLMGFVENLLNGIIGSINSFIGGFNDIVAGAASFIGADWEGIAAIPTVSLPRMAEGGIVTAPTVVEAGEAGTEAIIPLSELWKQMQGFIADAMSSATDRIAAVAEQLRAAEIGSSLTPVADALSGLPGGGDAPGTGGGNDNPPFIIYYQPQYRFDGEAPDREELAAAEKMSQAEFNRMAKQWLKELERTRLS